MNSLIKNLEIDQNQTAFTENGAASNHSTLNSCLDLFAHIGAMRGKSAMDVWRDFSKAFSEDRDIALKILFYSRDIRGGQGERSTFRSILKNLAEVDPDAVRNNFHNIPFYGRWDDFQALEGTALENEMWQFVGNALIDDVHTQQPSLCAQWAPSINGTKSARARALKLVRVMNWTERNYRLMLSTIRKRLRVVERDMCSKNWESINYNAVPSKANLKYNAAFLRNDENRRREYLSSLSKGVEGVKMNTATLFPYDLVRKYLNYANGISALNSTYEEAWKALPNYLEGNEHNGLVICDVSGSMYSEMKGLRPIDVSVSLAIYIAQRNVGQFKDYFFTFSDTPKLLKLRGTTLRDIVANLAKAEWNMSTNLEAVFNVLLKTANANSVPQDEMPSTLYIISDMQFNTASSGKTNYQEIRSKYEKSGYQLPKIVFWNVNAHKDQPATIHDENTILVSGANPNFFREVLSGQNPLDFMMKVVNSERYQNVVTRK
jgi:tetratricopeptide (TPR) repeat protein